MSVNLMITDDAMGNSPEFNLLASNLAFWLHYLGVDMIDCSGSIPNRLIPEMRLRVVALDPFRTLTYKAKLADPQATSEEQIAFSCRFGVARGREHTSPLSPRMLSHYKEMTLALLDCHSKSFPDSDLHWG